MRIYKVRLFVRRKITRGAFKGGYEDVKDMEEIIVDNIDYAVDMYEKMKRDLDFETSLEGNFGAVECFTPHVFGSGLLADWPDGEYVAYKRIKNGEDVEEQKPKNVKFFWKGA